MSERVSEGGREVGKKKDREGGSVGDRERGNVKEGDREVCRKQKREGGS